MAALDPEVRDILSALESGLALPAAAARAAIAALPEPPLDGPERHNVSANAQLDAVSRTVVLPI